MPKPKTADELLEFLNNALHDYISLEKELGREPFWRYELDEEELALLNTLVKKDDV